MPSQALEDAGGLRALTPRQLDELFRLRAVLACRLMSFLTLVLASAKGSLRIRYASLLPFLSLSTLPGQAVPHGSFLSTVSLDCALSEPHYFYRTVLFSLSFSPLFLVASVPPSLLLSFTVRVSDVTLHYHLLPFIRAHLESHGVLNDGLLQFALSCTLQPSSVGVETVDAQAGSFVPLAVERLVAAVATHLPDGATVLTRCARPALADAGLPRLLTGARVATVLLRYAGVCV